MSLNELVELLWREVDRVGRELDALNLARLHMAVQCRGADSKPISGFVRFQQFFCLLFLQVIAPSLSGSLQGQ